MAYFEHFPYTNFHDINLDRMIDLMEQFRTELKNFVNLNTVKYADPFDWNITTQYPTNTIVMDPTSGIAYISTQPVPAGAPITDTDYWTPIMDLTVLFDGFRQGVAALVEDSNTATVNSEAGRWIWVGNTLYQAQVPITAGDTYVPGGNVVHITVEDMIDALQAQDLILQGNIDTVATNLTNETTAREQAITTLQNEIADMKFPHYHATFHNNIYVAGTSGNDANDGSASAPVKTLKRAWDIMAEWSAGCTIMLTESGTYQMGYPVISAAQVHLMGGDDRSGKYVITPNVVIQWGWSDNNYTLAFYDCYMHMQDFELNLLISSSGDTKNAYLEAGKVYASNVTFSGSTRRTFGIVGGAGQFEKCTFNIPFRVSGGNVVLNGCKFNVPASNEIENVMFHVYRSATVTVINSSGYTTEITFPSSTTLQNFIYGTSAQFYFNVSLVGAIVGNASVLSGKFAEYHTCNLYGSITALRNQNNIGNGALFSASTVNGWFMNEENDAYNAMMPIVNQWNAITGTEYKFDISASNGVFILIGGADAAHSHFLYLHQSLNNNTVLDMIERTTTVPVGYTIVHKKGEYNFSITPTNAGTRTILVLGATTRYQDVVTP